MAISALTVTGPGGTGLPLALGAIGAITLAWATLAPEGQGCLPYMTAAKFKVYVGISGAYESASLAATVPNGPYTLGGLAPDLTRNLWVVAVDPLGNESEPAGPVSATTSPAPASAEDLEDLALQFDTAITDLDTEFSDASSALASRTSVLEATANNPTTGIAAVNAKVATEQTARISADSSLADLIASVSSTVGDISADARVELQANAAPGGAATSIAWLLRKTTGGSQQNAGVRFSMPSSGSPTFDITAAQFRLLNASGATVFLVDTNGDLSAGTIKAKEMFIGGVGVTTDLIATNAVTTGDVQSNSNSANFTTSPITFASVTVPNVPSGAQVIMIGTLNINYHSPDSGAFGTVRLSLQKSGTTIGLANDITVDDSWSGLQTWAAVDRTPSVGSNAYNLVGQAIGTGPTLQHYGGGGTIAYFLGKR